MRKEFFYDSVNDKVVASEDHYHKSVERNNNNLQIMTNSFNKSTRRGLSQKGSKADIYADNNASPQKNYHNPHEYIEMEVLIPKIHISKYFKTKYQGAYIPPS